MQDKDFEIYKSTMRKMMHIGRLHRATFEKNISNMGIHHSQHHLLMYIANEGEVATQKQIAEKFRITPAAVARSLKTLEAEGYIERSSIEDDCRCNKISITDKGKDIVQRSHILFKETDRALFEGFTDEDISLFNSYLDRIREKLWNMDNERCEKKTDEEQ